MKLAEFESLTYREMWDTYVEPNLPPEPDPEEERAEAEANAVAAAIMAGVDPAKVFESFKRERK